MGVGLGTTPSLALMGSPEGGGVGATPSLALMGTADGQP